MTRIETIGGCKIAIVGREPNVVVIYALRERGSDVVEYVGSTSGTLRRRLSRHVNDARRGSDLPVHAWLRNRLAQGFDVAVLEIVDGPRVAAEQRWIAELKPSLNLTDGGKGMSGHRFAGTEHARRIQAATRSGDYFDCRRCGSAFWRKRVEIAKGHNKFCSRLCSNTRHKGGDLHAT